MRRFISLFLLVVFLLSFPLMAIAQPEGSVSSDLKLSQKIPLVSPSINANETPSFTDFSWESFVALNWPADTKEENKGKPIGTIGKDPSAPRVWEFYATPEKIFLPGGVSPKDNPQLVKESALPKECPADVGRAYGTDRVLEMISKTDTKKLTNIPASILQETNKPLVDQKHHYVIYEIRLNDDEKNQIITNQWYERKNLEQYNDDNKFKFEPKTAKTKQQINPKYPGPIELKISWLLLDDSYTKEEKDTFYTTTRAIYVSPRHSLPEKPFCQTVTLGLLGFHIAHKLPSLPNDPRLPDYSPIWVWSTFSHVDAETYLYNKSCKENCDQNTLYAKYPYLWNPENLKAVQENKQPQIPTQVVGTPGISMPTNNIDDGNKEWQSKLSEAAKNSVWKNYQLIGTQWQGSTRSHLANLSIETYNQGTSSCIACHFRAKLPTKNSATSDFSYIFRGVR